MNAEMVQKALSIASKVAMELLEGLQRNESNAEIRERIASRTLILDKEIDELRAAQNDLDTFVRTGR